MNDKIANKNALKQRRYRQRKKFKEAGLVSGGPLEALMLPKTGLSQWLNRNKNNDEEQHDEDLYAVRYVGQELGNLTDPDLIFLETGSTPETEIKRLEHIVRTLVFSAEVLAETLCEFRKHQIDTEIKALMEGKIKCESTQDAALARIIELKAGRKFLDKKIGLSISQHVA
ncbi:hypothetical protein [Aestuariivirga litoralis]|uniref:hypothetical protein n=1 Tax=Aestuariivirga litoralis TaxID=2650924 RepID=UPI0018C64BE9|nr:hypothetical protein [Aestuariivirga litoralis]MBG1231082.1 hypothetical protein [Aestuariivirga litoralis]